MTTLEVNNLSVTYRMSNADDVKAVNDVSFSLEEGETLGIVGESGCGKSTLAKALIKGIADNGEITNGEIIFEGNNLVRMSGEKIKTHRWKDISLITQSAMSSLNPVYTIGTQIREAIQTHEPGKSDNSANERAQELLELVGISSDRVDDYPHQLSGGMRQRAIIAMSLSLDPQLIIADEPTTALDVIVQKQILHRIQNIQEESNSAMIMVTHDISVVAETCTKVLVMYGGEMMETGSVNEVFENAHHPYTLGLQNAFPSIQGSAKDLISIPGTPPDLSNPPTGCPFKERCPYAEDSCAKPLPTKEVSSSHLVKCHEPTSFETIRKTSDNPEIWQEMKENLERKYE